MKEPIAKAPSGRPKRIPVSTRDKLNIVNKDPNRQYRLIDSSPARIKQFEDGGWKVENIGEHLYGGLRADQGAKVDNNLHVGGGQTHVLVSIDNAWFEEDQRAKAAVVAKTEESMKMKVRKDQPTSDGKYGELSIETGK